MSSPIYFICATPGSSGNFLVRIFRNLIEATSELTQPTFLQEPTGPITRDFWFDNVDPGLNQVIHVPYRPDYTKLKSRFPGCKIVVVTHLISECNNLSLNLWESFYKAAYEFGAEAFFKQTLEAHSHLFSSTTLTPDQLTKKELNTFIKIIAYQKLLDGFHNLTVPTDPDIIEITHRDLYYNRAQVKSQIESFTGFTLRQAESDMYDQMAESHIAGFFGRTSVLIN
jgi:hypothetical protein